MLRAYKYRVYPSDEQKVLIEKTFGCVRYIWNWGLEKKIKSYEVEKKRLSCFDLQGELPALKETNIWLQDAYSQTLQMSLRNLDNAFTSFFKKNGGFPKFKCKHKGKPSCQFPQSVSVEFENNVIKFPKIGKVDTVFHRNFDGLIKTVSLSRSTTGKYFASILVDNCKEFPKKLPITENSIIGVDVGIKHFVTLSTGKKIDNPKFLKQSEQRLKVLQKRMAKKPKTSVNRKEAKLKVAKQYEHVANQRKDFLHKVSHELVCENQTTMIVCEDLNVDGMLKNHCLAKSISDVAWSKFFEFTRYKCDWYGKTFQTIGRFEPSSRICNACGSINRDLKLSDRKWTCPICWTLHDRAKNAAINIKKFGFIRFQGTGTESKQSPLERSGKSQER